MLIQIPCNMVAGALGLDKYLSRYAVWDSLKNGVNKEPDSYANHRIDFGLRHEDTALAYTDCVSDQLFFRQKGGERMRFNCWTDVNAAYFVYANLWSIAKVKCRLDDLHAYVPGDRNWHRYMAEIQTTMFVLNRSACYFTCWKRNGKSRVWLINRSEEYMADVMDRLEEFCEWLDTDEECPKKIGKRPKMPFVHFQQVAGAPPPEVTIEDVMQKIQAEAVKATTAKRLSNLEDRLMGDHPDFGPQIMESLKPFREQFKEIDEVSM